jgi:hypothetical protein
VSGNTITIDVPVQGGFGADRPINGPTLFSVTAFSGGRSNSTTDIYSDLDSTRSFDYLLGSSIIPPAPSGKRSVTGGGAIAGTAGDASFALNPDQTLHGKVNYVDNGAGVNFRSTRITSLTFDDATHRATVKGNGVVGNQQVTFTATVTDASVDTFGIEVSTGYKRGGPLTRGNVTIH